MDFEDLKVGDYFWMGYGYLCKKIAVDSGEVLVVKWNRKNDSPNKHLTVIDGDIKWGVKRKANIRFKNEPQDQHN